MCIVPGSCCCDLLIKLGAVLCLPQGSSFLEPSVLTTHLALCSPHLDCASLQPLSWSPCLPRYPHRCWGGQANSNVAFTGKRSCQKQLSLIYASAMSKAIEETQLCLVTLDLLSYIYIFLMFERILCKAQSYHSQQSPVQSHKRCEEWEWARDLIESASSVCLLSIFAGQERSC